MRRPVPVLIPIHTPYQEKFAGMEREIEAEGGPAVEVRVPGYGTAIGV